MLAALLLLGLAAILSVVALRRHDGTFEAGLATARKQAKSLAFRVPVAVLSAGFIAPIVPRELISGNVGPDSGIGGILIASVVGGVLPGGPMVSFPLALVFLQNGIGIPQLIAMMTGWSLFALHRMLIYELPLLGFQFVKVRLVSVAMLPPLAGVFAWAILAMAGH